MEMATKVRWQRSGRSRSNLNKGVFVSRDTLFCLRSKQKSGPKWIRTTDPSLIRAVL